MKIVTVVGARPQFVKAAPVSAELRKKHEERILHTGQHYDEKMSKIFFDDLQIPKPDINLGVGSDSHARQTADIMIGVEEYLRQEKPGLVLVYGDTNSTLAAAVSASKLHINVAHIEAGLRSFNRKMPEEINRIVADRLSNLLFCPTQTAVANLKNEGMNKGVYNVGDVMFDAAMKFAPIAEQKSEILKRESLSPGDYLLLTLHRAENTNDIQNMKNIVSALVDSQKQIVFPVHPRTIKYLKQYQLHDQLENSKLIKLLEPVSFIDMIVLEKNAQKILTDSGGVQKEAYFYEIPCITLRDETEWVETVEDGWNCIVGANYDKILEAIINFSPDSPQKKHFGDGRASVELCELID
ncbi:UDP-N-acetylglucosamine 2-epimerase (non-hydrolyzing) [candidate division KSB1 bacterium]|nr:UDP-N-acetylglucosamine 2-epimerase (non-hydrolyzing) [candidate division KSB1 bacterium]MBL7094767.1 UDP-N-acetylglucosamine 2-epimerase (non-hydrolyzing) [candidate division KSB1 bacterium]